MTTERDTPQATAETDALVTQTYRDVADERAPDHLDRAVLKEAASAARPSYSRLRSWTRPMAWAATVMLSVALVLEVSKVPGPQSVNFDGATPEFEVERPALGTPEELDATDDAPAEPVEVEMIDSDAFEETPAPATSLGRSSNVAPGAAVQAEPPKATSVAPVPVLQKRQRFEIRQDPVEQQNKPAPASSVDEFKLKDADMLRRAEDMARMQSGENNESSLVSSAADADVAALGVVAEAAEVKECDAATMRTPQTWFECIEKLEDVGRVDEARRERTLLQNAFPDFKP